MNDLGYELLDLDDGRKLERFGAATIVRPAPTARGPRSLPVAAWSSAHAEFAASPGGGSWTVHRSLPDPWITRSAGLEHALETMEGGQVGLFPEQAEPRVRIGGILREAGREARREAPRVVDLFGYTGGTSLAAAAVGARVTHVDASRSALRRARLNAERNGLGEASLRSIPEHVPRFVAREVRRGARYDAVALDPPTFGRGPAGTVWKIERDLDGLLADVRRLLGEDPLFVLFTAHTEAWTAADLALRLDRALAGLPGDTESGSLLLTGSTGVTLASGIFALRVF